MKRQFLIVSLLLLLATFPVLAQDAGSYRVAYGNFTFSLDPALAPTVNIVDYPADPAEFGPGFAEPHHTQFNLYDAFPGSEGPLDPISGIRLYAIADFEGYAEHENGLALLQQLLADRPDLAQYMVATEATTITLPFIPVYPAGQVVRARAQYVETPVSKGSATSRLTERIRHPSSTMSSSTLFRASPSAVNTICRSFTGWMPACSRLKFPRITIWKPSCQVCWSI
jgi:hypothetical protein